MKSSILTSTVAVLLGATSVSAHGYVTSAVLDGTEWPGYDPNTDPYTNPPPERIFRKIPGNGPVEDLASVDLQCNGYQASGSEPAVLSAAVTAGKAQSLQWTTWPDTHRGPTITYMAKCPGDCSEYEPGTDAVWFKIAEDGKHADGTWASDPLITNAAYTFTIPASLAPGNYIVRHELWALHAAYAYPGAQIYPSCFQVTVEGSGSATPSDLVAFPGAYTADTPGVVFDIYQGDEEYPIPGPAVWTG
ncbi:Esterase/lipase/thioesterase [Onygenales sp. PD_40]|nr:Esterase/lipase/thioesterase [Onygenales sp. PD_40]